MKPILFNGKMVKAILDGRKTTTRRLVKPQPELFYINGIYKDTANPNEIAFKVMECGGKDRLMFPPFQPGDILYVRETWGISNFDEDESTMTIQYKADDSAATVVLPPDKFQKYYDSMTGSEPDWRPSIFMPKEAARIFLRVTDVKAERLQDITEDGAKAEGCGIALPAGGWEKNPLNQFVEVWNSTVNKSDLDQYGWDANPWVWVISFERCEKPSESHEHH
jgi:hypothetical protein